jgi:plastocyanin
MGITVVKFVVSAGALLLAGATQVRAQKPAAQPPAPQAQAQSQKPAVTPGPVQIVALDECDPATFNRPPNPDPKIGGVGADFCKNVALGAQTDFPTLFDEAMKGHPDPNWDFEPDSVNVHKGAQIIVTNQGGEPHTFTEVKHFGGGFIPPLNGGEPAATECAAGFKDLAVARTRILQGSSLHISNLPFGQHNFQCCIHPWMRVTVEVKDEDHDRDHER